MTGSLQHYIRLGVWLLSGSVACFYIWRSVLLIARWIGSEKASAGDKSSSAPGIGVRSLLPAGAMTRISESRTAFLLLGLLIGATYGWMVRDLQTRANRYHYHDVVVLDRFSDHNFRVQADGMQAWTMETCEKVDWQAGQKMRFLDFQWHPQCDNVGADGAFQFYTERGKRMTFPTEEIVNARY